MGTPVPPENPIPATDTPIYDATIIERVIKIEDAVFKNLKDRIAALERELGL